MRCLKPLGGGLRMTDRTERLWVLVPVAILVLVLLAAQAVGFGTRRYLPRQRVHVVSSAAEGYAALRSDGVRGRVVVLLDERTRMVPRTWMATFMDSLSDTATPPPVMTYNSMSGLAYSGIARAIYFVPPAGGFWERELTRLSARPDSLPDGNGVRVRFNTVPVVLTKQSELPVFGEKIVVWLFEPALEGYGSDFVRHITDPSIADVVVRMRDDR
jgi:hypothetical protein